MSTITIKGQSVKTIGQLPPLGSQAIDFIMTKTDLTDVHLSDFFGKNIILNIFPSVDTGTCAAAERRFNAIANELSNTVILCLSADLPFAQSRFCAAENLKNVIPASLFRHPEFGKKYGVTLIEGPLAGLLSRAVVVIDPQKNIIYTQQVAELTHEPDYDPILRVLK